MKLSLATKGFMFTGIVAMLAACNSGGGSDGGGGETDPVIDPAPAPIAAITESAAYIDLEGSWLGNCLVYDGSSSVASIDIIGATATVSIETWVGSADCSGSSVVNSYSGTLELVDVTAVVGWMSFDGFDLGNMILSATVPPDSADGSRPLSDVAPFSTLNMTVTQVNGSFGFSAGDVIDMAFVIDDTGMYPVLYQVLADTNGNPVAISNMGMYDPSAASGFLTGSVINVTTTSGAVVDLAGSWSTDCYSSSGNGYRDVITVSPGNIEYATEIWIGDTGCTGASHESVVNFAAIAAVTTDVALDSWLDEGLNPAAGPLAADGGGEIPTGVAVTPIMIEIHASDLNPDMVGAVLSLLFVVDDGIPDMPVLYLGMMDGGSSWAYNFSPFSAVVN